MAHAHDAACGLCEHRCGADRRVGRHRGPCKAGVVPRLYQHRIEYADEIELVPSHLFYLSGCDLRCAFCIAGLDAFDPSRGVELTADRFRAAVAWGRAQGARNVQWIGGEPTIHLPALLDVMAACPDLPPVVWKTDLHATPEALALLDGVVQTYVADYKFGNDACAKRLAGVANYTAVLQRNLRLVARQDARLIVRHLVLPGHADCCLRPIVEWMRAELPHVPLSLRDGYMPAWRAERFVELRTPVGGREMRAARAIVAAAGLEVA